MSFFSVFEPALPYVSEGTRTWLIKKMFDGERKSLFYGKVASMQRNGVNTMAIFRELQKRYEKGKRFEYYLAQALIFSMQDGLELSEALGQWVTTDERLILQAGTASNIADALDRCNAYTARLIRIQKIVKAGLMGPVLNLIVLFTFLLFIGRYTLPDILAQVGDIKASNTWTTILFTLVSYTNSILFPLSIVGVLAGIYGVFLSFANWTGKLRQRFDYIVPWSAYRLVVGTSWLSALCILVRSGVLTRTALDQTYEIAKKNNAWLAKNIKAIQELYGAYSLGDAMVLAETGFPDKDLVEEIAFFSNIKGGEEMIMNLADQWGDATEQNIEKMMKAIEVGFGLVLKIVIVVVIISLLMFFQTITNAVTSGAM